MGKKLLSTFVLVISVIFVSGCFDENSGNKGNIRFSAKVINNQSKSIDMKNGVVVDEYNVIFQKVELGNSESDKFTLWENSTGETKNIAAENGVEFENIKEISEGKYKFCRITINRDIKLKGSYNGTAGTADVKVSGNFSTTSDQAVFLFGTESTQATGKYLLTESIEIKDDTEMALLFNIFETVIYSNGIKLLPPTLTITVKN